jgi:hypothetical protein
LNGYNKGYRKFSKEMLPTATSKWVMSPNHMIHVVKNLITIKYYDTIFSQELAKVPPHDMFHYLQTDKPVFDESSVFPKLKK